MQRSQQVRTQGWAARPSTHARTCHSRRAGQNRPAAATDCARARPRRKKANAQAAVRRCDGWPFWHRAATSHAVCAKQGHRIVPEHDVERIQIRAAQLRVQRSQCSAPARKHARSTLASRHRCAEGEARHALWRRRNNFPSPSRCCICGGDSWPRRAVWNAESGCARGCCPATRYTVRQGREEAGATHRKADGRRPVFRGIRPARVDAASRCVQVDVVVQPGARTRCL